MYTYQYSSCGILALLSCSAAVTISPLPSYDTKTGNQDATAVRGTATFVDGYGSRDSNIGGQGIYQHKNSGSTHHSPGNSFEPCRRIFGGMSYAGDYGTRNDDRYKHGGGSRYYGNEIDRDPYPPIQNRDYYPNFYPQEGIANNRYPQVTDDCGQHRRPEYAPKSGGWDGSYDRRPATYPGDRGRYPGDNGRYPGDNERYPADNGRYPADNGRYPGDSGRYPGDSSRYPGERRWSASGDSSYPSEAGRGDRAPHWGRGSNWDYDSSPPGRGDRHSYNSRPPYVEAPSSHGYQGRDQNCNEESPVRNTKTCANDYGLYPPTTSSQGNIGTTHTSSWNPSDPCRMIIDGTLYPCDYIKGNKDQYKYEIGGQSYHKDQDYGRAYPSETTRDYYPNFYPGGGSGHDTKQDDLHGRGTAARGNWGDRYEGRLTYDANTGWYSSDKHWSVIGTDSWYPAGAEHHRENRRQQWWS